MHLRRVSDPDWQSAPVVYGDAESHLRLNLLDTQVLAHVAAACEHVQSVTRRSLVTQTWELTLDCFPFGPIELPMPPLQSVESITYTDPAGATQTWEDYVVDAAGSRVYPIHGTDYPDTLPVPSAVTVRFVSGYAATPEPIRAAILLLVGDLYENREAQGQPLHENRAVHRLLWPYRWL